MKQLTTPHRSALTAIAAVLVLGSTPALAQQQPSGSDAGGSVPASAPEIVIPSAQPAPAPISPVTNSGLAPITVAPPVMQAPVANPSISQAPLVNPPVAEERAFAETARPAQRAQSPRAEAATPAIPARAAEPAAHGAAPVAAAREPASALAPSEMMAAGQAEAAPPAQPVAEPSVVASDNESLWTVIGGTGAVLLIGGAAYAMTRRRRIESDDAIMAHQPVTAPLDPVPTTVMTRDGVKPIATVDAPIRPQARSVEMEPMLLNRQAAGTDRDLESIAAAAPTAENPFRTRRNRLRRAHFLLHHEQAGHEVSPVEAHSNRAAVQAHQSQSQRSVQPVYDFGSKPVTYRPAARKPVTT